MWSKDKIQFARLLCELDSAGAFTPVVVSELLKNMDLEIEDLVELQDRATKVWDEAKEC